MRYLLQHIETITNAYKGELPLAHYLKRYFGQYPKLGSRDRRALSTLAYSWYRASKGFAGNQLALTDHLSACVRACGVADSLPKGLLAGAEDVPEPPIDALFPYDLELSAGMDREAWLGSMLRQPDLFIRIRKDRPGIEKMLTGAAIPYRYVTETCMALPNGAKIDQLLPAEVYAVQDASSQQTGSLFEPRKNETWYDCCSGAGGKSLLLCDMEPGVRLTASDRRESILHNLEQRFRLYRMTVPKRVVTDVSNTDALSAALGNTRFDNIICDAPCSGSGTWARTPEQLYFFDPKEAERFHELQRQIATNVSHYLRPGGRLIYITCSVFKRENEDVVNEIIRATGMHVDTNGIINGIDQKADSMYAAVLKKVKG